MAPVQCGIELHAVSAFTVRLWCSVLTVLSSLVIGHSPFCSSGNVAEIVLVFVVELKPHTDNTATNICEPISVIMSPGTCRLVLWRVFGPSVLLLAVRPLTVLAKLTAGLAWLNRFDRGLLWLGCRPLPHTPWMCVHHSFHCRSIFPGSIFDLPKQALP